jgi:hypothetical protein
VQPELDQVGVTVGLAATSTTGWWLASTPRTTAFALDRRLGTPDRQIAIAAATPPAGPYQVLPCSPSVASVGSTRKVSAS